MVSHSALKREGILTLAATWLDLEDTVLSETSQSEKDTYCRIPLDAVPGGVWFTETDGGQWEPGAGTVRVCPEQFHVGR